VLDPVRRERIWQRIAGDLRLPDFDAILAREVTLEELPNAFQELIDAKATGRTLVRVGRS
jgi:acrylyl-CoA reductase (NADPH)